METATLTICLDGKIERELGRACARTGRTRSDMVRDALR
ncbi:MAG: ribbon-helix-helix protein, CopG family, partial [Alphaproteobacteria bacterium]